MVEDSLRTAEMTPPRVGCRFEYGLVCTRPKAIQERTLIDAKCGILVAYQMPQLFFISFDPVCNVLAFGTHFSNLQAGSIDIEREINEKIRTLTRCETEAETQGDQQ